MTNTTFTDNMNIANTNPRINLRVIPCDCLRFFLAEMMIVHSRKINAKRPTIPVSKYLFTYSL